MVDHIDRASSFRFGVALGDNTIGLFAENIDPIATGYAAPIGSTLFSPTQGTFQKIGPGDNDWSKVASAEGVGYYSFSGGLTKNAHTGDYLGQGGVGMNSVPFVVPFNSQFIALSASTNAIETWRLMVQYFDTNTQAWTDSGAFIDITSSNFGNQEGYGFAVPAGTRLAFQVQNSVGNVSKPRGFAFLKKV